MSTNQRAQGEAGGVDARLRTMRAEPSGAGCLSVALERAFDDATLDRLLDQRVEEIIARARALSVWAGASTVHSGATLTGRSRLRKARARRRAARSGVAS